MTYILMNKEIADAVKGIYSTYYELCPVEAPEGSGVYILPASVLDNQNFSEAHALLSACTISEYEPAEIADETT